MIVKIFPRYSVHHAALADFLRKHGFNMSGLDKHGYFLATLSPESKLGVIDTKSALEKLRDEPKVSQKYEFFFQEIPPNES